MAFAQSELSSWKTEKPAQQIDSRAVAHLAHHALLWTLIKSMIWHSVRLCIRDTQNYPSDRQGNWRFADVSGTHHTQRHSAKVPEETILAWSESNRASLIKQLISDEIVLMRMSKPKANTLNISCGVFVRNCQFFMMFNACVYCGYEQIDTCYVSQGSVMTFVRRSG